MVLSNALVLSLLGIYMGCQPISEDLVKPKEEQLENNLHRSSMKTARILSPEAHDDGYHRFARVQVTTTSSPIPYEVKLYILFKDGSLKVRHDRTGYVAKTVTYPDFRTTTDLYSLTFYQGNDPIAPTSRTHTTLYPGAELLIEQIYEYDDGSFGDLQDHKSIIYVQTRGRLSNYRISNLHVTQDEKIGYHVDSSSDEVKIYVRYRKRGTSSWSADRFIGLNGNNASVFEPGVEYEIQCRFAGEQWSWGEYNTHTIKNPIGFFSDSAVSDNVNIKLFEFYTGFDLTGDKTYYYIREGALGRDFETDPIPLPSSVSDRVHGVYLTSDKVTFLKFIRYHGAYGQTHIEDVDVSNAPTYRNLRSPQRNYTYIKFGTEVPALSDLDLSKEYYIKNVKSGHMLTLAGSNKQSNGVNIIQSQHTIGDRSQKWKLVELSGNQYYIKNVLTNKVLDVGGWAHWAGGNVIQWSQSGGNNQKWIFSSAPNDAYFIKSVHSSKFLEIAGASGNDGANVQQWHQIDAGHQHWSLVEAPSTISIDVSKHYKIINVHSGKALSIWGWSHDNGVNLVQWQFNNTDNMKWRFEKVGDAYKIINVRTGKVVDVDRILHTDGANVHQWTYYGTDNQKWRIKDAPGNGLYIENVHANKVLDVSGWSRSNGGNVQQWHKYGSPNQRWYIVPL